MLCQGEDVQADCSSVCRIFKKYRVKAFYYIFFGRAVLISENILPFKIPIKII